MATQIITVLALLALRTVGSSLTSDKRQSVTQYLNRFGYQANQNLSNAVRMFQRMSGLEETGVLSDDVYHQTLVSRCGGLDVFHDHDVPEHPFKVLRYHIQQYPDPETSLSSLTREEIDEVVLAASKQWTDPMDTQPRLVKSESKEDSDIVIVFCSFAQCLAGYKEVELARPALGSESSDHPMLMSGERGARMTVYLDSQQAWAGENTLTSLAYGAAFNVHIQLLQVMIHQFGHMLGLGHSSRQTSVMTPFYLDWVTEAEVGPDPEDREAIRIREEPYSGSQSRV